jgi:hypothetical protein
MDIPIHIQRPSPENGSRALPYRVAGLGLMSRSVMKMIIMPALYAFWRKR